MEEARGWTKKEKARGLWTAGLEMNVVWLGVVCTRGRVRKRIAWGRVSWERRKGIFQESIKIPREKKNWQRRWDKRMEDRMIGKQGRSVEYLKCVWGYLSPAITE